MADDVRLVDLDVVKRYSLAVRKESAPAREVLAALEASREYVLSLLGDEEELVVSEAVT